MVELTLRITGAPSACESSISEAIQLGGDKPLRTAEVLVDGKTILLHLIELPEPSDRCDSGENTQRESLLEDKVGPEVDGAITIYNEDDPKGRQAVLPILSMRSLRLNTPETNDAAMMRSILHLIIHAEG